MTTITFILPDGKEQSCTAIEGRSVMETALENSVAGIIAECNGSAACATCHVIFEDALADKLDAMEEHENDMLDFTASTRETGSRLSCQVRIDSRLEGARIHIPAEM